ncbi:hypothetical protein ACQ86D_00095 [Streptomyces galilaeus]
MKTNEEHMSRIDWTFAAAPVMPDAAGTVELHGRIVHQLTEAHDIQLGVAGVLIRPMLCDLIRSGTWERRCDNGQYRLSEGDCHHYVWHRLHRSYVRADGTRVMHTRPDETLRTAGLEDLARYWGTARRGDPRAVSRTVNASVTHGPDARVDRVHGTSDLLPAVTGVDVIEVSEDDSDHHIVRVTLDGGSLSDILNQQNAAIAA